MQILNILEFQTDHSIPSSFCIFPPAFFFGSIFLKMTAGLSKTTRAVLGLPFLVLAVLCILTMDVEKMLAHQQPFLESGNIEYDGGSIAILERFHYFEFLDELWRGATVTFSPATLGYDSISSWQMFSFLQDLGPVYAVWYLESYRAGNRFTPAYL